MGLKLMLVIAHPDDECFGFGGALVLAADRGVETYVVCLTEGRAGSYRGDASSEEELGQMRREEFAASCEVLRVKRHEILNFDDGKLEFIDFSKVAGMLVDRMRSYRPDVVLTFAGDGGLNIHPDHMMVSSLATSAFHWSGRAKRYPDLGEVFQPKRLFYASTNFFLDGRQAPLPPPWTVVLDTEAATERKRWAFEAHKTQAPLMQQTEEVFARYGGQEFYTMAATDGTGPARVTGDLFEGLEG